jgi:hydrogenase nickel incorporation protein HypA/HybF
MHEASLAQQIATSVAAAIPPDRHGDVRVIRCLVGELSGVQPLLLEGAFAVVAALTPFPQARLACEAVPTRVHCAPCDGTFAPVHSRYACPRCGTPSSDVVAGTELLVSHVVYEAPATAPSP